MYTEEAKASGATSVGTPASGNTSVPETTALTPEQEQQLDELLQAKLGVTLEQAQQVQSQYNADPAQYEYQQALNTLATGWSIPPEQVTTRVAMLGETYADLIEQNDLDNIEGLNLLWSIHSKATGSTSTPPAVDKPSILAGGTSSVGPSYKYKQSDINKMSKEEKSAQWGSIVAAYNSGQVYADI